LFAIVNINEHNSVYIEVYYIKKSLMSGCDGPVLHIAEGVLAIFGFPEISVIGILVYLPIA
jgi:hypothetical protein